LYCFEVLFTQFIATVVFLINGLGASMTASESLEILLLGALMGLLGQGARAVAGLKTMTDDAQTMGVSPNDLFQAARLFISLAIGVLVGLAAALIYLAGNGDAKPDWHILLGFAAAGYTGTDFLEAFISKYLVPPAQSGAKTAALVPRAPMPAPAPAPAPAPSTPKELVYSVILQLEPGQKLTDGTLLAALGWDDYGSLDDLLWHINQRHWRGLALPDGALAQCTKVSDVTAVVTAALAKPAAPQPKPAV
jgi:hypothetical protein